MCISSTTPKHLTEFDRIAREFSRRHNINSLKYADDTVYYYIIIAIIAKKMKKTCYSSRAV